MRRAGFSFLTEIGIRMIILHQLDPIALQLGPLQIHWYGVTYALAFAACWFLGRMRIRAGRLPGVDETAYGDLLFYCMLGVVLGGRLGYILFYDLSTYLQHPLQVFKVWEGGMSFHGGLLGVLFAAWLWSRQRGLHFFDVADFIAPLVPPGLGFGRIGNYINGELWGKFTGADWGVVFPGAPEFAGWSRDQLQAQFSSGALAQYARHPSPLYEAVLEGLVMFVVLWWYSRTPRPRYRVAALFALMYGSFRFLVEFVRVPDPQLGYLAFGWQTMGQLLEVTVIAFGRDCLWRSRNAPTVQPQPLVAAAESR
jgi:phosphatidylglycerol:prolipoprotein diacylglycerol transferase